MQKYNLDEEIERRESEKFKALESQTEEIQKNLNAVEKKEFERLWSFYCNNLEEIQNRTHQITQIRIEEATLEKESKNKIYVLFPIAFAIYITDYFLNIENNFLVTTIFAVLIYFFYILIKKEIQVASKNIEAKLHSNAISEIRHTLSLKSMFNIKYEREYIEAYSKLYGGSEENEKQNFEKYKNLHFTSLVSGKFHD